MQPDVSVVAEVLPPADTRWVCTRGPHRNSIVRVERSTALAVYFKAERTVSMGRGSVGSRGGTERMSRPVFLASYEPYGARDQAAVQALSIPHERAPIEASPGGTRRCAGCSQAKRLALFASSRSKFCSACARGAAPKPEPKEAPVLVIATIPAAPNGVAPSTTSNVILEQRAADARAQAIEPAVAPPPVGPRWRVRVRVLVWEEQDVDLEAATALDALSLADQRFAGHQTQVVGVNLIEEA